MTPLRARRFERVVRLIAIGGAATAVAVGAAVPLSGATVHTSSLPSAKTLIKDTLTTMSDQSSVHLSINSNDKKTKQSEQVSEDAGRSNGDESIQYGSASAAIRLTSEAAYVSGNTLGLERLIGLTSKGAKTVGDKWIILKKGSSQFTGLVQGVTIVPLAKALLPTSSKSVLVKSGTLNGHGVFAMTWTDTAQGAKINLALDIASHGATLPIQLTATQGTFVAVTQFTKWGERISVDVPKKTIAYSKVPT